VTSKGNTIIWEQLVFVSGTMSSAIKISEMAVVGKIASTTISRE
jgi:hypothetical protein